ncbi:OmpA family protein [Aurantivibrio infirmus]
MKYASKKLGCYLIALSLPVLATQGVSAQDIDSGVYINPNIGYYTFGTDRNLKDQGTLGLGVGYQFNKHWASELNYLTLGTEVDASNGNDVDLDQIRIDMLYNFDTDTKFQPFLAAGVGENRFDNNGTDYDETVVGIGGGVKYFFTERLSLRGDVRLFDSLDEEDQDVWLGVGLNYIFGARRSAPAAISTPATAAPVDSDGDGVFDSADRCPNTPSGRQVDSTGCELDSDNDGVVNSADNCPDTSAGAKVDERGCYIILTETREIELEINFANNSAEIQPQYVPEIQEVANFMREYPLTKVVVEGHTDDRGAASYNQQLSERRAQAVAAVLVNQLRVASDRVSAIGKGEVSPIATNDTAEGRASNRRVVGVVSATVETRQ